MKTLGNKEIFSIEYELTAKDEFDNAKVCFWVKNKQIGNFENPSPIYGVYLSLKNILAYKSEIQTTIFIDKTPKEIFLRLFPFKTLEEEENASNEVQNELLYFDNFRFSFNQSFDIYLIRIYIENNYVCFIWKLLEEYEANFPNYGVDIKYAKVPLEEVEKTFKLFENDLIDLKII